MTREEFDEKCTPLHDRYNEIFYETLKERAFSIGLSKSQWEDLCGFTRPLESYTDFFSNLEEELNRRYENGYYDISDLYNPSTKNLKFQITETIIRKEFLRHIISMISFDKKVDYLADLDIYEFYEMFRENKLEEYIKQKIPLHSFDNEISINYTEDELIWAYNNVFKDPLYPEKYFEFNMLGIGSRYRDDIFALYEKDPDDKDSILKFLKKTAGLFNDFSEEIIYCWRNVVNQDGYIKETKEEYKGKGFLILDGETTMMDENGKTTITEGLDSEGIPIDSYNLVKHPHFLNMNGGVVDKLDWYLVEILRKFKKDILLDDQIVYLYYGYITGRLKGSIFVEQLVNDGSIKSNSRRNFIGFDEIKELILEFKSNQDIYEILQIYYMLYSDILKRGECEQLLKEAIYRMKKISDKNNHIVLGIKEYLTYIMNDVFIYEYGGDKPEYFDSIAEDIKEVLGEEGYKSVELLLSKKFISKGDKIIRKSYKIGLVFGDSRSKEAFDFYSNDKKSEKDFACRQLTREQFDILAEDYFDQQDLDIEGKLKRGDLNFVLVFETNQETKLKNLMKLYPDRIIVCNIPGQHFSHIQFCKMLDLGLENAKGN